MYEWALSDTCNIFGSKRPPVDMLEREFSYFALARHAHSRKNALALHGTRPGMDETITLTGYKNIKHLALAALQNVVPRPRPGTDTAIRPGKIAVWYAAGVPRCEQTAHLLIQKLNQYNVFAVRRPSRGLTGVDLGPFAGLTYAEMAKKDEDYATRLKGWRLGHPDQIWPPDAPGGEPTRAFLDRMILEFAAIESSSMEDGVRMPIVIGSSSVLAVGQYILEQLGGADALPADLRSLPMPETKLQRGKMLVHHIWHDLPRFQPNARPQLVLPPAADASETARVPAYY